MYVLFTGNTGVGKSSVIDQISSKVSNSVVFSDPYTANPFISSAYLNNKAFQSEIFFIKEFFKTHTLINTITDKFIFQERSIYECVYIFSKLFMLQKKLDENEYNLCNELVTILSNNFRKPDLIIHLTATADTIAGRIAKRNRHFETGFDDEIINLQSVLYRDWVHSFSAQNSISLSEIDTTNLHIGEIVKIVFNIMGLH